jgi:NADPH:quinone reductase-like Zn-dependent oxidoreductase
MKAIQVTQYGDPGVLTQAELPDPVPGPGESRSTSLMPPSG